MTTALRRRPLVLWALKLLRIRQRDTALRHEELSHHLQHGHPRLHLCEAVNKRQNPKLVRSEFAVDSAHTAAARHHDVRLGEARARDATGLHQHLLQCRWRLSQGQGKKNVAFARLNVSLTFANNGVILQDRRAATRSCTTRRRRRARCTRVRRVAQSARRTRPCTTTPTCSTSRCARHTRRFHPVDVGQ